MVWWGGEKTAQDKAALAAVPQNSRKVPAAEDCPKQGDFEISLVDTEAAIIKAGYRSRPHVVEDTCWLTGTREKNDLDVNLTIFQRRGVDVPMIDRLASRVTVQVVMAGEELPTPLALASPAAEAFAIFGGDGPQLKTWLVSLEKGRWMCELNGCQVFASYTRGGLLVEFTRLAE